MGKWTVDYYDNVLSHKIKSLVLGAIRRSILEKAEPTISFESFVEDFDVGDSFTASLVDILVKELAERKTRPNQADRRLIADRSAKSLRLLATPLRVYRDRPLGTRPTSYISASGVPPPRHVNLTPTPEEIDMDDDLEEFENFLGGGGSLADGARTSTEFFDAYGTNAPVWQNYANNLRRVRSETTALIDPSAPQSGGGVASIFSPPGSPPPPNMHGPWTFPAHSSLGSSSLTRQPSIRRAPRPTRTVDFNDFTSRRRSTIRAQDYPDDSRSEGPSGSVSNTVAFTSSAPQLPRLTITPARRFFPSATRRRPVVQVSVEPPTRHFSGSFVENVTNALNRTGDEMSSVTPTGLNATADGSWLINSPTDRDAAFSAISGDVPPQDPEENETGDQEAPVIPYSILGSGILNRPRDSEPEPQSQESQQLQPSQNSESQVATALYPTPSSSGAGSQVADAASS